MLGKNPPAPFAPAAPCFALLHPLLIVRTSPVRDPAAPTPSASKPPLAPSLLLVQLPSLHIQAGVPHLSKNLSILPRPPSLPSRRLHQLHLAIRTHLRKMHHTNSWAVFARAHLGETASLPSGIFFPQDSPASASAPFGSRDRDNHQCR